MTGQIGAINSDMYVVNVAMAYSTAEQQLIEQITIDSTTTDATPWEPAYQIWTQTIGGAWTNFTRLKGALPQAEVLYITSLTITQPLESWYNHKFWKKTWKDFPSSVSLINTINAFDWITFGMGPFNIGKQLTISVPDIVVNLVPQPQYDQGIMP
jgi:hypothetical protein